MPTPTRFPGGLATARKGRPWAEYGNPAPQVWHDDFDDFNRFAAAEWAITRVGTTPTEALIDETFGVLQLATVASASSSTFLQKIGASFLPVAGKKLHFSTRFKVSDATDTAFAIGLQVTDTTPLDVTDGIYFLKPAASTAVQLICRKDATTGSVATGTIATLANDTYVRLSFYYDGRTQLHAWVNDRETPDLSLTVNPAAFLPDTALRVSFGVANGASSARTMNVDNIFASLER